MKDLKIVNDKIKYEGNYQISKFSPDGKYYVILINTETSYKIHIHDSSNLNKSN